MRGYFSLSGQPTLPDFRMTHEGPGVGARSLGRWGIATDLGSITLNIPSRDKQVMLWHRTCPEFVSALATLDSSFQGLTYADKLTRVLTYLPANFVGMVSNISTDTHSSIAVLSNPGLSVCGLVDTKTASSYLLWAPDGQDPTHELRSAHPLRFLVYRMPRLHVLFLPAESVCSKWHRWSKTSALLAFNALERKLCGTS